MQLQLNFLGSHFLLYEARPDPWKVAYQEGTPWVSDLTPVAVADLRCNRYVNKAKPWRQDKWESRTASACWGYVQEGRFYQEKSQVRIRFFPEETCPLQTILHQSWGIKEYPVGHMFNKNYCAHICIGCHPIKGTWRHSPYAGNSRDIFLSGSFLLLSLVCRSRWELTVPLVNHHPPYL